MHGGSRASTSSDGRALVTFAWSFVRRKKLGPLIRAADAAMAARQWLVAAELYAQVLEARPALWHLRVQRGHALKELGHSDAAIAEYRTAAEVDQTAADPWLYLGHVFRLKGDRETAARYYRRALQADPNCAAAHHLDATGSSNLAVQQFVDSGKRPVVYWDVATLGPAAPAASDFDEEARWFEELGRQTGSVLLHFDATRGRFIRVDDTDDPVDHVQGDLTDVSAIFVTSLLSRRNRLEAASVLSAAQLSLRAAIVGVQRNEAATSAPAARIARQLSGLLLASQDVAGCLRSDGWRHQRADGSTVPIAGVDQPMRAFATEPSSGSLPVVEGKPGNLLFGWPAETVARAALKVRLARLAPCFDHCIAFAAEVSSMADHPADDQLPAHAETFDRSQAWHALAAPETSGVLLPLGMGSADLWAIRAADSGIHVFVEASDARVLTAIGGAAIIDSRGDGSPVGHRLRAARSQPTVPPISLNPWVTSLQDVVAHAAHQLKPAHIGSSVHFGVLYGFDSSRHQPPAFDAGFLLAGAWDRTEMGVRPGDAANAKIRIVVATSAEITCQLLVSDPATTADRPFQWQQVKGRAKSIGADGFSIVDLELPMIELHGQFGAPGWEIRGMVFYPTSLDHHWFEFLDRASRGIECQ